MAVFLTLLFSLLVSSSFISSIHSKSPENNIDKWCDETTYPETCKQYFAHNPIPKRFQDFRKVAIQIALKLAIDAHGTTKNIGPKCRNAKEKAAWTDCIFLYEDTIQQLNNTLSPAIKCTAFDAQTWISTALTNLETCKQGFTELGVPDIFKPLVSNSSLDHLICNCLSLGNDSYHDKVTDNTGFFPNWVSPRDRKLLQTSVPAANLVVAKDGSGNYATVQAAIDAASKRGGTGRFVIHVKQGVYSENVLIGKGGQNIMLVGDGIGSTVITGSRSVVGGSTTFNSATVAVVGDGFMARDITFRNTAGPQNQQAVALRSGSDLSVFYRCSIEGYQDTLYVYSQRQFYRECNIYGTVDFIFGNAAVVLQSCNIFARKPISGQQNTVTAQGRIDANQNTGISIHNSRIQASSDLSPVVGSVKSYLGRPWKQYSRTVILTTFLDSLIAPAGWLPWSGNFALDTLFYGEYQNTGPGSSTTGRVTWKGYRVITSPTVAAQFSVTNFILGQSWLPATGVPFTAGV